MRRHEEQAMGGQARSKEAPWQGKEEAPGYDGMPGLGATRRLRQSSLRIGATNNKHRNLNLL